MPKGHPSNAHSKKSKVVSNKKEVEELESNLTSVNLLQVITAIAGILGIIVAFLWMFGYSYYNGLLYSIGIPSATFYLTNEDFINRGKSFFLLFIYESLVVVVMYLVATILGKLTFNFVLMKKPLYLLVLFIISGTVMIIGMPLILPGDSIFSNLLIIPSLFLFFITWELLYQSFNTINYLIKFLKVKTVSISLIQVIASVWRVGAIIFTTIILIQTHNLAAASSGYINGCITINEKETSISIITSNESSTRNDYFLAMIDKNYYYIYQEINQETLKPKEVLLIQKDVAEIAKIINLPVKNEDTRIEDTCEKNHLSIFPERQKQVLFFHQNLPQT